MKFLKYLLVVFIATFGLIEIAIAQSTTTQCLQSIENDPATAPIKGKVAFNPENQSVEILVNKQKPTSEERKAILAWDAKRTECINAGEANQVQQPYSAPVRAVELNYQEARKNLIAELYGRNLTYGEFAKKSSELYKNASLARVEAINQTSKQINDEMARDRLIRAQENQARAAQRNAETNRQMEADYMIGLGANILNSTRQVAPAPTPNPRNVQCVQQGVFTNCTGY